MMIYDQNGVEQDWKWLHDNYGDVAITSPGPGALYRAMVFREVEGPSALTITVRDQAGGGVDRQRVAFYWPDAPEEPGSGYHGRCVYGHTDMNGAVGFGMGPGAYYDPNPTVPNPSLSTVGPHSVWLFGGEDVSEMVSGLGMLAGSNHRHIDVEFWYVEAGPGPEPEPEPPPHPDPWPPEPPPEPEPEPTPPPDHPQHWWTLFDKLDRIIELLEKMAP